MIGLQGDAPPVARASIQGVNGGSPDLENEESESVAYRFTWTPPYIEGLSIAADYYKIEIDNVITSLTATQLASSCFDSTSFDETDVPNANAYRTAITIGTPEEQHQLNVGWSHTQFGLNLSANYQGSAVYDLLYTSETQDILRVDSYWLLNAGVSFRFSESLEFRGTITNLLDEEPPFPAIGTGVYDQLGRRYSVAFSWKL